MTVEEMRKQKKKYGYSYEYISQMSGVPVSTIQKVFSGVTASPRLKTMRALTAVLDGEFDDAYYVREESPIYMDYINDSAIKLYTDDRYDGHTLKDYLALPDEQRAELIDGVFYDMGAPVPAHQIISNKIAFTLESHVNRRKGTCTVFSAPTDVQLDEDDKTVVQPDIFVVCDRNKIRNTRIFGAPDLVIEILSPTTKGKDMYLKGYKYRNAGVREYWIVNPINKYIIVYDYEHNDMVRLYSFTDSIPVTIWDGACEVDFAPIQEAIAFLEE
ncbi:MAG: Uma2 family endonuclease [Lachnospiraceae bacterium]|nr:Uma2 family endonuclease [Lachnospiraceae bacterium]